MNDGCTLELRRFTLTKKSTLNMMYGRIEWYLLIFPYLFTYIYSSIYVFVCLSICVSVCLFVCQSIYLSICPSLYLSIYLLIYPSVFVYLYNVTVEWYDCDSFEMLFDDDWSEILLQKTLLHQRKRIFCLIAVWTWTDETT